MSTLLVIGNGFDLSLDAKTSYDNFFNSEYFSKKKKAIEAFWKKTKAHSFVVVDSLENGDCLFINCWELLFYIESLDNGTLNVEKKEIRWCDVERVIHDSMTLNNEFSCLWNNVFNTLHTYYYEGKEDILKIIDKKDCKQKAIALLLIGKAWKPYCLNQKIFYKKLLNELQLFEKDFGQYISEETNRSDYQQKAKLFSYNISQQRIRHIDSFNYSSFIQSGCTFRHINGDAQNPIFGIDASKQDIKNNPPIRLFTKTSRRLYQDSYGITKDIWLRNNSFSNAVIYGHSLNTMDYDYFYYLFSLMKINTYDPSQMGSLEFVYTIYDREKENDIRDSFTEAVYRLLNAYEDQIGHSDQQLLINLMRFSGKLKIYDIDVQEVIDRTKTTRTDINY